jgi:hypothetical protein
MRLLVLSVSALCAACLGATCASAQTGQWGQAEDQIPPYRTHIDRRHGHDHVYPNRGAVVRDLPPGAIAVNYAGLAYRFSGGVWYQRLGPAYIVVVPPIGLVVPQLPDFATNFDSGGKTYIYADDVFYRPRPDLGGYEVVNDPQDLAPERAGARSGGSQTRVASAAPSAAAAPAPLPAQPAAQSPAQPTAQDVASPTAQPDQPAAQPAGHSTSMTPSPTAPDAAPANASAAPANPTGVAIYPRNGQSADQQAMDRYECYRFAVGQTGFDPLASNSSTSPANLERRNAEYSRAQAACLEGRGYRLQ